MDLQTPKLKEPDTNTRITRKRKNMMNAKNDDKEPPRKKHKLSNFEADKENTDMFNEMDSDIFGDETLDLTDIKSDENSFAYITVDDANEEVQRADAGNANVNRNGNANHNGNSDVNDSHDGDDFPNGNDHSRQNGNCDENGYEKGNYNHMNNDNYNHNHHQQDDFVYETEMVLDNSDNDNHNSNINLTAATGDLTNNEIHDLVGEVYPRKGTTPDVIQWEDKRFSREHIENEIKKTKFHLGCLDLPANSRLKLTNYLSKLTSRFEDDKIFDGFVEKEYDANINRLANGSSWIFEDDVIPPIKDKYPKLAATKIGPLLSAICKKFAMCDPALPISTMLTFSAHNLAHCKFQISAQYHVQLNTYIFLISQPGSTKTPIRNYLQDMNQKLIDEFAATSVKLDPGLFVDGITKCLVSGTSSLSKLMQNTEKASGILTFCADEFNIAEKTFGLTSKKADGEGIAIVAQGMDGSTMFRQFINSNYNCFIKHPVFVMLYLAQPELAKFIFSGGKAADTGTFARFLLVVADSVADDTFTVRYGESAPLLEDHQVRELDQMMRKIFTGFSAAFWSNLRSLHSKFILKYDRKTAAIMTSFAHAVKFLSIEYFQHQREPYFSTDFASSLSKMVTQCDKIVGNLFWYDYWINASLESSCTVDEEFFNKHLDEKFVNGTYFVKDPKICYAAMELICKFKSDEARVYGIPCPALKQSLEEHLEKKMFVDLAQRPKDAAKRNDKEEIDAEDDNIEYSESDSEDQYPNYESVQSFEADVTVEDVSFLKAIVCIPGKIINWSYIASHYRHKVNNIPGYEYAPAYHTFYQKTQQAVGNRLPWEGGYYLFKRGFGLPIKNSRVNGAANIFIKPDVCERLQVYVDALNVKYGGNQNHNNNNDIQFNLDQYYEPATSIHSFTKDILVLFYQIKLAPSEYIKDFKAVAQTIVGYKSSNKRKKIFDGDVMKKELDAFVPKALKTMVNDNAVSSFVSWYDANVGDLRPTSPDLNIHKEIFKLEQKYKESLCVKKDTIIKDNDNKPKKKSAKKNVNYFPVIHESKFDGCTALTDFVSIIESFWARPSAVAYLASLEAQDDLDEKWCADLDIDNELYQSAMGYEKVADTTNYNRLLAGDNVPKEWRDGWMSNTKSNFASTQSSSDVSMVASPESSIASKQARTTSKKLSKRRKLRSKKK